MPSSFATLTLDQLHEDLLADYANRFPGADVSRYSDTWKRLRVTAGGLLGLDAHLETLYDDLMPDRAAGSMLDRHGAIYGVARKAATPARKADALRVYGSAGSSVSVGAELTHADGTRYQVSEAGTIATGATYVDVDIVAIDTGSATKKTAGTTLTFVSPPAGINQSAELQKDLDEDGVDAEDDGSYRVRILDRIAQPAAGGNANDYRTWAEEVTGVESAYVYPLRGGDGSVHLAFLHAGRGSVRLPTASEIAEVQAYVDERRPVSVRDFAVLTVTELPTDVIVDVLPLDAEHAFDWDDQDVPSVASWTASTRVLAFAGVRPATLKAGDRLTYRSFSAPYGDGAEVVVEALGPGALEVTLTKAPAVDPKAGDYVYAGGPLVEPIRQAILAHIDELGPARGTYAAGSWEGTLRTSSLFRIAQTTDGVLDSLVVQPSTNLEPANTAPNLTVQVVTPRQVLVRRWWP